MPVTSTSAEVDCSAKDGASRWIEEVKVVAIGPASSIGSPMTFMMRPSVAGPTGTVIGRPVSNTGWPRVRPSVVSMAMARTVFSPRCWATSNTRRKGWPVRWSVLVVSSALWIAGRWPSNSTSTTAPMICTSLPVATALAAVAGVFAEAFAGALGAAGFFAAAGFLAVVVAMAVSFDFRLERFGAGDDLDQLLGDLRLA